MNVELGKKSKVILDSFTNISQSAILRNDYLFAKTDSNPAEDKGKGTEGIIGIYDLPQDEVSIESPLGFFDVSKFLKVLSTFDSDTLSMNVPEDSNILHMKDKTKKIQYEVTPIEMLPQRQTQGETVYEAGERVCTVTVSNDIRNSILKDMATLDLNELYIVSSDNSVKLKAASSTSSSTVEYEIPDDMVMYSTDVEVKFTSGLAIDAILPGNYRMEVKKCNLKGKEFFLTLMTNVDFEADIASRGNLRYFLT